MSVHCRPTDVLILPPYRSVADRLNHLRRVLVHNSSFEVTNSKPLTWIPLGPTPPCTFRSDVPLLDFL